MPRTASPAVSVIVPLTARAELNERAGAQLRAQTLSDIEIVLVGGTPGADEIASLRADERVKREAPGQALCDALNAGLDACRGERIMIFDPRDELEPRALEALAVRMRHGGESGAFGGFRFRAPIGDLPQDPLKDAPDEVGFDELARQQWFGLSVMMVDSSAIGGIHFRSEGTTNDLLHPADYEWLLRLAEVGVRWSRSGIHIGAIGMRRLASTKCTAESLTRRANVLFSRTSSRGWDSAAIAHAAQDAVDAHVGLMADHNEPPTFYSAQAASSAEMARWWHRLGFVGPAPSHLRPAMCRDTTPVNELSIPAKARAAAEALDPMRPVVLVGSGHGIQHFAGISAGLGMPLRAIAGAESSLSVDTIDAPDLIRHPDDAPPGAQFVASDREQAARLEGIDCTVVGEMTPAAWNRPALRADGTMPPPPAARGLYRLPDLIASKLASEIDGSAVLVGLGRNARRLARALHAKHVRMQGFDHSHREPPFWCELDGLAIHILDRLPTECASIVIPIVHDAVMIKALSEILPPATRVVRWATTPDVLFGLRASIWMTLGEAMAEMPSRGLEVSRSAA